jgi:hypothetical protein
MFDKILYVANSSNKLNNYDSKFYCPSSKQV